MMEVKKWIGFNSRRFKKYKFIKCRHKRDNLRLQVDSAAVELLHFQTHRLPHACAIQDYMSINALGSMKWDVRLNLARDLFAIDCIFSLRGICFPNPLRNPTAGSSLACAFSSTHIGRCRVTQKVSRFYSINIISIEPWNSRYPGHWWRRVSSAI